LLWLSGWDRGIPFLVIFSYIYATYYALPIFFLENYTGGWDALETIPSVFVEEALMLSLFGLFALFMGYYLFHGKVFLCIIPQFKFQWEDYTKIKTISVVMGCIGIIMYGLKSAMSLQLELMQSVNFISNFSMVAIAILYILQLRGFLTVIGRSFLWGVLVPTRILMGLATGATLQGLEIVLLLILIYAALRHSIPWKVLIAGGIALLVLRSVQVPFRALTWAGGESESRPLTAKMFLFAETAAKLVAGEELPYDVALQVSLSRLAHLMTFAEVIEITPAQIPFWGGETFYPLLFKPIPRFLYPDKPEEISGQTFGHRYGFLSPNDSSTSYNLPQLVELYANFGMSGILAGMFFLGALYRILQCIFVHPSMGLGAVVGGAYSFTQLLLIESSFSLVIGGLFWVLIFLGLLHMVMKTTEYRRKCS
jgi:hypothetical protein